MLSLGVPGISHLREPQWKAIEEGTEKSHWWEQTQWKVSAK